MNILRSVEYKRLAKGALVVAVGTAACSSTPETTADSAESTSSIESNTVATRESPGTIARLHDEPTIVFDDLGGGDPIIMVYPGPTEAAEDRVSNGEYPDGEEAEAECKVLDGRHVVSHPEVGEQERASNDWVKLKGLPYFATVVYIEDPEQVLAALDSC